MLAFSVSGFSFNEFGCIRTSNGKVVCCHFSSDGKLLASAGHEKKVLNGTLILKYIIVISLMEKINVVSLMEKISSWLHLGC